MGSRWKKKGGAMIITPDGIALEGEGWCDDHHC